MFTREMLGFLPDPRQEELLRCEAKQTIFELQPAMQEVDCCGGRRPFIELHSVAKSLVVSV